MSIPSIPFGTIHYRSYYASCGLESTAASRTMGESIGDSWHEMTNGATALAVTPFMFPSTPLQGGILETSLIAVSGADSKNYLRI